MYCQQALKKTLQCAGGPESRGEEQAKLRNGEKTKIFGYFSRRLSRLCASVPIWDGLTLPDPQPHFIHCHDSTRTTFSK